MSAHLVAERYANALEKAVPENAELEDTSAVLTDFAKIYSNEPRLVRILENPAISFEKRQQVLEDVLAALEGPEIAKRLIHVMAKRGRISIIDDVAAHFRIHVDERLSRVTAHVTTAVPLEEEQLDRIRESLKSFSKRDVRIVSSVDPSIVGGIVARLNGTVLDGSLRSRLNRAKQMLLSKES